MTCYEDTDGDTYGNPQVMQKFCAASCRPGYVTNRSDCFDRNPEANPGTTGKFFNSDRGDGSFDYNCDGQSTKDKTTYFSSCAVVAGTCAGQPAGGTPTPDCGMYFTEVTCIDDGAGGCFSPVLQRPVGCR